MMMLFNFVQGLEGDGLDAREALQATKAEWGHVGMSAIADVINDVYDGGNSDSTDNQFGGGELDDFDSMSGNAVDDFSQMAHDDTYEELETPFDTPNMPDDRTLSPEEQIYKWMDNGMDLDAVWDAALDMYSNEIARHDIESMVDQAFNPIDDDGQPDDYTELQDFMGGDDGDHGQFYEEMDRVRKNAGLPPMVREGDPFGRQSKRNLKNPKARMSLINPSDKISSGTLGEDDVDEAKAAADWAGNRQGAMDNRLDRSGYGDRDIKRSKRSTANDKYAQMAKDRGIPDRTTPQSHEMPAKKSYKPRYEEVEMPHHLPKAEKPSGTPKLSEDSARIVQLARYDQSK